jgi:hypothetical protein
VRILGGLLYFASFCPINSLPCDGQVVYESFVPTQSILSKRGCLALILDFGKRANLSVATIKDLFHNTAITVDQTL